MLNPYKVWPMLLCHAWIFGLQGIVIHFSKKQSKVFVRSIMNVWTLGRSHHAPDREHNVDTLKIADFYDTVVPTITYFVHLWDVIFSPGATHGHIN
jgi:hypothetical protein